MLAIATRSLIISIFLSLIGPCYGGRSYIDYPEFRRYLSASLKEARTPWYNGTTEMRWVLWGFRFADGRLAKVTVDWKILWTERKILQASQQHVGVGSTPSHKEALLSSGNAVLWQRCSNVAPSILPADFFGNQKWGYGPLWGNSNNLIMEGKNYKHNVNFKVTTRDLSKKEMLEWGTRLETLKSNVQFDPENHITEGSCCVVQ
jgi:hypothetical protein